MPQTPVPRSNILHRECERDRFVDGPAGGAVTLDRRIRILSRLGALGGSQPETKTLCGVGEEVTEMSGAGIMLMSGDVPGGSVCSTNTVSPLIEHLQYELGEGPCVDAYNGGHAVLEPDLAQPDEPRWLAFA